MSYFNKKNPWFWAFIVLLVLNVSAIGTMIYTINRIHNSSDNPPSPPPIEKRMSKRIGKILEKKMGYTKDQIKILRTIRFQHMTNMRKYQKQLKKLQSELFNEISSTDEVDSLRIKNLKDQILQTHALMIDESNSFYNKVKENSSAEQLEKLNKFYKKMLFRHSLIQRRHQIKQ